MGTAPTARLPLVAHGRPIAATESPLEAAAPPAPVEPLKPSVESRPLTDAASDFREDVGREGAPCRSTGIARSSWWSPAGASLFAWCAPCAGGYDTIADTGEAPLFQQATHEVQVRCHSGRSSGLLCGSHDVGAADMAVTDAAERAETGGDVLVGSTPSGQGG